MTQAVIIDSPLGKIDAQYVTLKCECGGNKIYSGDMKTTYPGICDWKCDSCGKKGDHYSYFPVWYEYLPVALRHTIPCDYMYYEMDEHCFSSSKRKSAQQLIREEDERDTTIRRPFAIIGTITNEFDKPKAAT